MKAVAFCITFPTRPTYQGFVDSSCVWIPLVCGYRPVKGIWHCFVRNAMTLHDSWPHSSVYALLFPRRSHRTINSLSKLSAHYMHRCCFSSHHHCLWSCARPSSSGLYSSSDPAPRKFLLFDRSLEAAPSCRSDLHCSC